MLQYSNKRPAKIGKRLSIKDVRSRRGLFSADKGGSSDADVHTFWCKKKTLHLSKLMVCLHRQGGKPVRTRGVNFSRFYAAIFMDGLLRYSALATSKSCSPVRRGKQLVIRTTLLRRRLEINTTETKKPVLT